MGLCRECVSSCLRMPMLIYIPEIESLCIYMLVCDCDSLHIEKFRVSAFWSMKDKESDLAGGH